MLPIIEKSMGLQFFIVPEHTAIPVSVFRAGELPAAGFRTKTKPNQRIRRNYLIMLFYLFKLWRRGGDSNSR